MHSLAILSDMTHVVRCSICNVTYANDILVRRKWLFYYYYSESICIYSYSVSVYSVIQKITPEIRHTDTCTRHTLSAVLKTPSDCCCCCLPVRSLQLQHAHKHIINETMCIIKMYNNHAFPINDSATNLRTVLLRAARYVGTCRNVVVLFTSKFHI